ncbi:2keto4pentenoate hydratase EC 42180 [Bradyrhizobium sp.]|nr:2keto4pentenoate hydratase EC 42180 [Bradyrhizobium sp.]
MIVGEDEPVAAGRVLQPKIEAEVAFLLDRDIEVEMPTVTDVARAVAYAMPALEIVGSRIIKCGIVDTVADNASSGLFVLGGPVRRLDGLDLRALQMQMTRKDEVVSKGTGAACLGNPLSAMAWLAGELARRKRPLRAGDLVLSGALGPMVPVNPADAFEANIAGSGPFRHDSRKHHAPKEHQMKLVRFGNPGAEKLGLIDDQGRLRDLSDVVADITPASLSRSTLQKIAAITPSELPLVTGEPRSSGGWLVDRGEERVGREWEFHPRCRKRAKTRGKQGFLKSPAEFCDHRCVPLARPIRRSNSIDFEAN